MTKDWAHTPKVRAPPTKVWVAPASVSGGALMGWRRDGLDQFSRAARARLAAIVVVTECATIRSNVNHQRRASARLGRVLMRRADTPERLAWTLVEAAADPRGLEHERQRGLPLRRHGPKQGRVPSECYGGHARIAVIDRPAADLSGAGLHRRLSDGLEVAP